MNPRSSSEGRGRDDFKRNLGTILTSPPPLWYPRNIIPAHDVEEDPKKIFFLFRFNRKILMGDRGCSHWAAFPAGESMVPEGSLILENVESLQTCDRRRTSSFS